ncbi:MAG: CBS domain-containing protein [Candidatus Helarchaeota archaeon]|nr:CBS domain-containing protein [Candidatus Helarchaeota archaeon]
MKRISVQDIMARKVIGVDYETKVDEIIKIMGEKKIGSIVILDKEKPVGMITIRQLLQIAEKCTPPASLKAGDVMSSPVITVQPNVNLRQASILMLQKGIKKLVVEENGKLIGLLTTTDIERVFIPLNSVFDILKDESAMSVALREEFQKDMEQKLVEELMTKDVKTITISMKINEIAKIMNQTKIGSLIVTKDEKAIGIVTDVDIMRRIMNFGLDPCSVTAEEAMEDLVTIFPKDSLKSAVEKMIDKTVKKLGVIDSNEALVGIITTTDFLVYYRSLLFRPKILDKIKRNI